MFIITIITLITTTTAISTSFDNNELIQVALRSPAECTTAPATPAAGPGEPGSCVSVVLGLLLLVSLLLLLEVVVVVVIILVLALVISSS